MLGTPSGWVKLPPVPSDEEYEILKQERLKREREWMEAQTKQGGWIKKWNTHNQINLSSLGKYMKTLMKTWMIML